MKNEITFLAISQCISNVFPNIRPVDIIISHGLQLWILLENSFFQFFLSINGLISIVHNIIIADCDPNAHVNAILEYGASETVPDWTVTCQERG